MVVKQVNNERLLIMSIPVNTAPALQLLNQLNEMTSNTEKSELENKLINEIIKIIFTVYTNYSHEEYVKLFTGENMKLIDFICDVDNPILEQRSIRLVDKSEEGEIQTNWSLVHFNGEKYTLGITYVTNKEGKRIKCYYFPALDHMAR